MELSVSVTIDLSAYSHLMSNIKHKMAAGVKPFDRVYEQWATRYRGYINRRFVTYSRGGGDWPPLKQNRKIGNKETDAILRDTSTLFQATTPVFKGFPGQVQENIVNGIRVAIAGSATHPSGKLTVGQIAEIHQEGKGNVPVREIFDVPPKRVTDSMADDADRAIAGMISIYDA